MQRTLTTIGADDTAFERVCNAINEQIKDRNLLGDLDGIDASFDVCVSDAVQSLSGTWDMRRTASSDDYYVALDGAPLSSILPKD